MSRPASVSVVIGVYNGEKALPITLDSIFSQRDVDFDVVVVDDGSTDGTASILQHQALIEPRLQVHRQQKSGLTRALINGVALARGEFIARQDVGDISDPTRLSKQLKLLVSNPGLALVSCQFVTVGPGGEMLSGPEPMDEGESIIASLANSPSVGLKGPHHGSVMIRRSAYEQVGGYRPEFYFAQDLDLWSRLVEVGGLAFVDEALYQVRFGLGSITALHRPQQLLLRDLIREATLLRRNGQSEKSVLKQAAAVRNESNEGNRQSEADAEYFIGSCLHRRGDPAAELYLRRAVAASPLHFKAWAKLLHFHVRHKA